MIREALVYDRAQQESAADRERDRGQDRMVRVSAREGVQEGKSGVSQGWIHPPRILHLGRIGPADQPGPVRRF